MKESIKKLRHAYDAYMSARQVRYNELTNDPDLKEESLDVLKEHNKAVKRINMEEIAIRCEWRDGKLPSITATALINNKGELARYTLDGDIKEIE